MLRESILWQVYDNIIFSRRFFEEETNKACGVKELQLGPKSIQINLLTLRAKMWWNCTTRSPENFLEFGIAQNFFKTKLLHVSYLINSATLYIITTKDNDRRIVIVLRFGLTINILTENFTHF